jgi:hypothetical protein
LTAIRPNTTAGRAARGAVSIKGNTDFPPLRVVGSQPTQCSEVGINRRKFHRGHHRWNAALVKAAAIK